MDSRDTLLCRWPDSRHDVVFILLNTSPSLSNPAFNVAYFRIQVLHGQNYSPEWMQASLRLMLRSCMLYCGCVQLSSKSSRLLIYPYNIREQIFFVIDSTAPGALNIEIVRWRWMLYSRLVSERSYLRGWMKNVVQCCQGLFITEIGWDIFSSAIY